MAFKVITDNGLDNADAVVTDANAYVSVADFLAYWTLRNIDYTDYEVEVIQANIVKATDYIERRFGMQFKGIRVDGTQALAWPRNGVRTRDGVLVEGVPPKVRQACSEYAARSLLGTTLWSDPIINRNIKKTVKAIGPIRNEVEYIGGGLSDAEFPNADALLAEYVSTTGSVIR